MLCVNSTHTHSRHFIIHFQYLYWFNFLFIGLNRRDVNAVGDSITHSPFFHLSILIWFRNKTQTNKRTNERKKNSFAVDCYQDFGRQLKQQQQQQQKPIYSIEPVWSYFLSIIAFNLHPTIIIIIIMINETMESFSSFFFLLHLLEMKMKLAQHFFLSFFSILDFCFDPLDLMWNEEKQKKIRGSLNLKIWIIKKK